jgi:hypothetical protein
VMSDRIRIPKPPAPMIQTGTNTEAVIGPPIGCDEKNRARVLRARGVPIGVAFVVSARVVRIPGQVVRPRGITGVFFALPKSDRARVVVAVREFLAPQQASLR